LPESIPASLVIDTLKDAFREARASLRAEVEHQQSTPYLGWVLSVADTHQKTVITGLESRAPSARRPSAIATSL
jgi:hypothetical protein